MGKHFTYEMGELGFRLRCDFGIIHGAATSLSCLLSASRYSTENGGRLPLFLPPNQKMGKLQHKSTVDFCRDFC
jgi:hypothetical protein